MRPSCRLRLVAGTAPPLGTIPRPLLVTLHAAGGLPRFAAQAGNGLRRSALGELVRQRWLNMSLEYPDIGFGSPDVQPDHLVTVLHLPGGVDQGRVIRGVIAHFKATVTRDAAGERPVWAPGYEVVGLSSAKGTSRVRPSRAITVSGKIAAASASSSGASRV